jgi:ABC-type transporter Mla subunit MlaD
MGSNDQVSARDFQVLEKRVTELERRMDRNMADLNKTLQSAKGSDDSLIKRLEKVERTTTDSDKTSSRLDKIVEDLNKRLVTAKSHDDQLDQKIDKASSRLDKVVDDLNKRLVTAKGYDDQLDQKIATLRKQIDSKG